MLDIEKSFSDTNYRIVLTHNNNGVTTSVSGISEADMVFNSNIAYDNKDTASSGYLQQKLNAVFSISGTQQMQLKNIRDTLSEWSGNPKQQLNVAMTIVAYKPSINTTKEFLKLDALTRPTTGDGVIWAPGNYSPTKAQIENNFMGSPANGLWTIRLGNWWLGTNFILQNLSGSFSREIVRTTGTPLLVRINAAFSPALITTKQTVESWYLKK